MRVRSSKWAPGQKSEFGSGCLWWKAMKKPAKSEASSVAPEEGVCKEAGEFGYSKNVVK